MAFSVLVAPVSGPTPGSFEAHVGGGVPPYDLRLAPSPPNADPPPDVEITGSDPGPWTITVKSDLAPGEHVYVVGADGASLSMVASYTST